MGDVVVDIAGLLTRLRDRDYYSLPLEIKPKRSDTDLAHLASVVCTAIDRANILAAHRVPDDPTWCRPADVASKSLVAEIDDGLMTEDEVLAWLSDFAEALDGHPVRVVAPLVRKRIPWPEIESWAEGSTRTPTAFLFFTAATSVAPNRRIEYQLHPEVLGQVADDLEEWVRLPSGVTVVSRGLTDFICPPGRGATELQAAFDEQISIRQYTLSPKRHSMVHFTFGAEATLQLFDETRDAISCLEHLLAGLRMLAPLLEYAYVRMDRPVLPHAQLGWWNVAREPTEAEDLFRQRYAADEYAIAPCVAQVLNPRHLAKRPDLTDFTSEEVGNGRSLVVARNPAPWLGDANPTPEVIAKAERDFKPVLLTRRAFEDITYLASE